MPLSTFKSTGFLLKFSAWICDLLAILFSEDIIHGLLFKNTVMRTAMVGFFIILSIILIVYLFGSDLISGIFLFDVAAAVLLIWTGVVILSGDYVGDTSYKWVSSLCAIIGGILVAVNAVFHIIG